MRLQAFLRRTSDPQRENQQAGDTATQARSTTADLTQFAHDFSKLPVSAPPGANASSKADPPTSRGEALRQEFETKRTAFRMLSGSEFQREAHDSKAEIETVHVQSGAIAWTYTFVIDAGANVLYVRKSQDGTQIVSHYQGPLPAGLASKAKATPATDAAEKKPTKRKTPKQLLADVRKTPLGAQLIKRIRSAGGGVPAIGWGSAPHRAAFDGEQIVLNETLAESLSDRQWMQIIAMELGNAANEARIQEVRDHAEEDPPSREEYIEAIERIEFESRAEVLKAVTEGQFGAAKGDDAFDATVTDFETYMKAPEMTRHHEDIGRDWDEYYKSRYEKRHRKK